MHVREISKKCNVGHVSGTSHTGIVQFYKYHATWRAIDKETNYQLEP